MTTPAIDIYPSAPLEKTDLEQRLEKKQRTLTVLITQLITSKNCLLTSKTKIKN